MAFFSEYFRTMYHDIAVAPCQTVFQNKVLKYGSVTFSVFSIKYKVSKKNWSCSLPQSFLEQIIVILEWRLKRQYFKTKYHNIGVTLCCTVLQNKVLTKWSDTLSYSNVVECIINVYLIPSTQYCRKKYLNWIANLPHNVTGQSFMTLEWRPAS